MFLPELSEGMASPENALRPTAGGLFRVSPTPWIVFDLDAKEEGDVPYDGQMRLTGMVAMNFDRRRKLEVKAQCPLPGSPPAKCEIKELQTQLDFISIIQHFPWWRRVKALRAGGFYSILMTEQGNVFLGVVIHVTVCPDLRGGTFVHTHLVKADSKHGDHLQSCRKDAQFRDLRPSSRRIPVGWFLGVGKSLLRATVALTIISVASAVWHMMTVWMEGLLG